MLPALAGTIGATTASPSAVAVGVPTMVTVTSVITDPSLVAGSVNLQKLNGTGQAVAIVGTLQGDGKNDGIYTIQTTVYQTIPGTVTFRVSAAFKGSLSRSFSAPVNVNISGASIGINITSPPNLFYTNTSPVNVIGTVGDPNAKVAVNGINAPVANGQFRATVPLVEGLNTLTAVATNSGGTATTASVQVTLDTTPPHITIDSPNASLVTTAASLTISGTVNDIVLGTVNSNQATVTVNGLSAQVSNRSFIAQNVPLVLGGNTIQAVARDRAGNSATTSIQVQRLALTQPVIKAVSGDAQSGPISSPLAAPLIASLTDNTGRPVSNQPVTFQVVQNNGLLSNGLPGVSSPMLTINTDLNGQARAQFTLGSRAGAGNNVVQATALGYAGIALFAASGVPTGAAQINADSGAGQSGALGQPLTFPFVAVVTDKGHNRVANVPVSFTVKRGGGNLNGNQALLVNTDTDGRALAVLTLGTDPGQDNNVVEANFPGNAGLPAAFSASAKAPGNPAATVISGVVLTNNNLPIPGVTVRLYQTNQGNVNNLPVQIGTPVQTNAQGQFAVQPAPVGFFKLMADGTTAPGGTYPTLEFDIVSIAGQNNTVGMPIYLPALDTVNKLCVNASIGGTLTLPSSPGFSLTVAPGAATFPGGSKTGCVTVTPVNGDKVPMAPGFGQQPRFVVTIQPVGTTFNPPAAITFPNVDGLKPRQVTELYSYDHDLSAFVAIGTGTVSTDGSLIISDPGVGVLKAGWHCGGDPNPTGAAGECGYCAVCDGSNCQADDSLVPPQTGVAACKINVCSGGSVKPVADPSQDKNMCDDNVCNACSGGGCQVGAFTVSLSQPPDNPNPSDSTIATNYSFLSTDTITSQATVDPSRDLSTLSWTVVPTLYNIMNQNPPTQTGSSFSFMASLPPDSYVKGTNCNNPGNGSCNRSAPLSYAITASFCSATKTATITQDQVDIIRQEYVNHGLGGCNGGGIPGRADIALTVGTTHFGATELNQTAYIFSWGSPGTLAEAVRAEYNRLLSTDVQVKPLGTTGLKPTDIIVRASSNAGDAIDNLGAVLYTTPCNKAVNPATCTNSIVGTTIVAGASGKVETSAETFNSGLKINSGWRNPERNEAVGGVVCSDHQFGNALDLSWVPIQTIADDVQWCVLQTAAEHIPNTFVQSEDTPAHKVACTNSIVSHVHVSQR